MWVVGQGPSGAQLDSCQQLHAPSKHGLPGGVRAGRFQESELASRLRSPHRQQQTQHHTPRTTGLLLQKWLRLQGKCRRPLGICAQTVRNFSYLFLTTVGRLLLHCFAGFTLKTNGLRMWPSPGWKSARLNPIILSCSGPRGADSDKKEFRRLRVLY